MDSFPPAKKPKLETDTDDESSSSSHLLLLSGVGIADLPFEVLEQVFAYLPIYSLTLCQLVCRAWNSIIANPKFLKWKKLYYSVKSGHGDKMADNLLCSFKDSNIFIPSLIRSVDEEFADKLSDYSTDLLGRLQHLPSSTSVLRAVSCLPEVLDREKKSLSLPATVSLMVVFSHSVEDTILLLWTLTSPNSAPLTYIVDLFYFLCYLFYQLWRCDILPHRLHYNIYYALDVFERPFVPKSNIERKLHVLTPEQLKIVGHNFGQDEIIKIVALAGTGKTTTLVKLVEKNPHKTFLYTAFNKSMVMAAEKLFSCSNVQCKTFHSIAYSGVQSLLNYPRSKLNGPLGPSHLSCLEIDAGENFKKDWIVKTLEDFFASDDQELSLSHVPFISEVLDVDYQNERIDIDEKHRKKAFDLAKIVWREMLNLENYNVSLPHDGYLKLYQLQHPLIPRYDCILVDEAQDMTPAIKSIVDRQPCCKFFVGDPHQKIYSFRGAINALEDIEPNHTFYLTQSFRFGPTISYLSSCILDVLKGVHRQTLTGNLETGGFSGVLEGQVAFISRTNAVLFELMLVASHTRPHVKIAFTGGSNAVRTELNTFLDIYRYMKGTDTKKIKNKVLQNGINKKLRFEVFKEEIMRSNNMFLQPYKMKIKLVERYGERVPELVKQIRSMMTPDLKKAEFVFTTAHKSKGLEFDTVVVSDDFAPDYFGSSQGLRGNINDDDENNLVYVAVTRAKKQVFVNRDILEILGVAGEHRMYFKPPAEDKEAPNALPCVVCSAERPPSSIYRHGIQTRVLLPVPISDRLTSEGPVCVQCAGNHLPYLRRVLQ